MARNVKNKGEERGKTSEKSQMARLMHWVKQHKFSVIVILVLVLFAIFFQPISAYWIGTPYTFDSIEGKCPFDTSGNNASLTIKYFTRPDCPACWKQELTLRPFMANHQDEVKLEKYDSRVCRSEKRAYTIRGTPSFVFIPRGSNATFTHFGYLGYSALQEAVA